MKAKVELIILKFIIIDGVNKIEEFNKIDKYKEIVLL